MDHHILQVITGREEKASKDLQALGYIVTLPMKMISVRDKTRRVATPKWIPLLPGYLGISGYVQDWGAIYRLPDVIKPLMADGEPANVGLQVMKSIEALANMSFETDLTPVLNIGEKVKITAGAGQGMEVVVTGLGTNKVQIDLGGIPASISSDKVTPL